MDFAGTQVNQEAGSTDAPAARRESKEGSEPSQASKPLPEQSTSPGEGANSKPVKANKNTSEKEPANSNDASGIAANSVDNHSQHSDKMSQGSILTRIFGNIRRRAEERIVKQAMADVLATDENQAIEVSADERRMMQSVLKLGRLRVEDIMVARAEMQTVDVSTSLGDLLKQFECSGHSRLPVYDDGLDDPKGMIHIRDVMTYISGNAKVTATEAAKRKTPYPAGLDLRKVNLSKTIKELGVIRPVLFVPLSMMASDLMGRMQASRTQMALVIDEYGGTDGLVCMEDIVEVIVGDIEDEHDEHTEELIIEKENGAFWVDARTELHDLKERIAGFDAVEQHGEDVDTIGGMVFSMLGRIPVRGEVVEAFGHELRILEADPRRIRTIEVAPAKRRGTRKVPPPTPVPMG